MEATTDGMVRVTLSALRHEFELGGRCGNVVTFSTHPQISKGWRLLQIAGVDVIPNADEIKKALAEVRKKAGKGQYAITFFGGKGTGGGGMNLEALAKAAKAAKKLKERVAPPHPQAPAAAAPASKPGQQPPPLPPAPFAAAPAAESASLFSPKARDLRHEFISFDFDRDGVLNFCDFAQMLQQLNATYSFIARDGDGPELSIILKNNFVMAGGRRPDPEDLDDEGSDVSYEAFATWYASFMEQLEQRKKDEYEATKNLSVRQYEAWLADRPMHVRNKLYPMLQAQSDCEARL